MWHPLCAKVFESPHSGSALKDIDSGVWIKRVTKYMKSEFTAVEIRGKFRFHVRLLFYRAAMCCERESTQGGNVGIIPVLVAPCEQLGHILLGLEALHELDDLPGLRSRAAPGGKPG